METLTHKKHATCYKNYTFHFVAAHLFPLMLPKLFFDVFLMV